MSLFADLKVFLRFHDNCGKNITLSNNNQTAQWTLLHEYDEWDGVVMSHDPMLTDMLYQVSETLSVSVCLCLCLSVSLQDAPGHQTGPAWLSITALTVCDGVQLFQTLRC